MFKYEIWFDSYCLHEDDDIYDTEEETKAEAIDWCFNKMRQWETCGVYDVKTLNDFDIVIKEITQ